MKAGSSPHRPIAEIQQDIGARQTELRDTTAAAHEAAIEGSEAHRRAGEANAKARLEVAHVAATAVNTVVYIGQALSSLPGRSTFTPTAAEALPVKTPEGRRMATAMEEEVGTTIQTPAGNEVFSPTQRRSLLRQAWGAFTGRGGNVTDQGFGYTQAKTNSNHAVNGTAPTIPWARAARGFHIPESHIDPLAHRLETARTTGEVVALVAHRVGKDLTYVNTGNPHQQTMPVANTEESVLAQPRLTMEDISDAEASRRGTPPTVEELQAEDSNLVPYARSVYQLIAGEEDPKQRTTLKAERQATVDMLHRLTHDPNPLPPTNGKNGEDPHIDFGRYLPDLQKVDHTTLRRLATARQKIRDISKAIASETDPAKKTQLQFKEQNLKTERDTLEMPTLRYLRVNVENLRKLGQPGITSTTEFKILSAVLARRDEIAQLSSRIVQIDAVLTGGIQHDPDIPHHLSDPKEVQLGLEPAVPNQANLADIADAYTDTAHRQLEVAAALNALTSQPRRSLNPEQIRQRKAWGDAVLKNFDLNSAAAVQDMISYIGPTTYQNIVHQPPQKDVFPLLQAAVRRVHRELSTDQETQVAKVHSQSGAQTKLLPEEGSRIFGLYDKYVGMAPGKVMPGITEYRETQKTDSNQAEAKRRETARLKQQAAQIKSHIATLEDELKKAQAAAANP